MTSTAQQVRSYQGPAILSYGFRLFFLAGAAWAAIAVGLWLGIWSGKISLPTAFSPMAWHAHEMIFGYVPAVIAGFLLTAVPNWTGRLPVVGAPLAVLFLFWLVGRLAIALSLWTGAVFASVLDLSFLLLFGLAVAREIVAGENWGNLKILLVVGLIFVGNLIFHIEAINETGDGYGLRIGIGAIVLLIMLIGGRVVPSFTRNWLSRQTPGRLPVPFGRFDVGVLLVSGFAMASWVVAPDHAATTFALIAACVANLARLGRWAGQRTTGEPLVLVLHVAYAFVPIGFGLLALAILRPDIVTTGGALHGWTAGAIPLMTLAVMTRASLGHTGQPLTAGLAVQFIYAAAFASACTRLTAAFDLWREPALYVSGLFWILAFGGFVCVFGRLLTTRVKS